MLLQPQDEFCVAITGQLAWILMSNWGVDIWDSDIQSTWMQGV